MTEQTIVLSSEDQLPIANIINIIENQINDTITIAKPIPTLNQKYYLSNFNKPYRIEITSKNSNIKSIYAKLYKIDTYNYNPIIKVISINENNPIYFTAIFINDFYVRLEQFDNLVLVHKIIVSIDDVDVFQ
jgi:hypothetical protein